jgi:hypothetical protein
MGLLALGCGGSGKNEVVEPGDDSSEVEESDSEETGEDELIPAEKFDEIRHTLERKASHISRCFPEAVEAGELTQNDKIKITVGLTIQPDGSPSDISILETTKESATVEECVKRTIGRWEFTTLPQSLKYSYGFVLQHF